MMTSASWRLSLVALVALPLLQPQQLPAQNAAGGTASSSIRLDTAAILASAKPEIEEANKAWLPGLRNRDADAIVAAYTDSGLFIAPDGTITRGRDAVRAMYVARFPRLREIRSGGIVQDGIRVAGPDLIYEWGRGWIEMVSASPGGPTVRTGGGYLTVWKRQVDGHWRIIRNLSL